MTAPWEHYKVCIPEGERGEWRVERFTISEDAARLDRLRASMNGYGSRGVVAGTFTRLTHGNTVVMSDTRAEINDHRDIMRRAHGRVLLNGLGLGMVLAGVLAQESVEHVDVVELSPDVLTLVAPSYDDPRVTFHEADAYEQCRAWPRRTHWDVAWHDIWNTLNTDNLPLMAKLHRSYGRRVDWQGSWGKELLEYERRRDSAGWWNR